MTEEPAEDWQGLREELLRLLNASPRYNGKVRPFMVAARLTAKTFYAIERGDASYTPDERTIRRWLIATGAATTLDTFYRRFGIPTPGDPLSVDNVEVGLKIAAHAAQQEQTLHAASVEHRSVLSPDSLAQLADTLGQISVLVNTLALHLRDEADAARRATGSNRPKAHR
tara:strand:- start:2968 stop:3477 length:510 start_codon:yes stop_codon:yes gene_type:complete